MSIEINKVNGIWDTHTLYKTINHTHMSYLYDDSNLIDLMLVECGDGRWFIVDDTSELNDPAIHDKCSEIFSEPRFFKNEGLAIEYAIKTISETSGDSISKIMEHFKDATK